MSCPLLLQSARNLLRPSPSLAHHVTVFLADKGSPAELRGILTANLSCRSSLAVHRDAWSSEKGKCSQEVAASASELQDGLGQRGLQRSGGE
jgi:hypothetical protein